MYIATALISSFEVSLDLLPHIAADVQIQVLHRRCRIEKQDALDQRLRVLHLVDRLLLDVITEAVIAPVVAHLSVQEVLVDGRQFLTKRFVEVLDDFRVSTHPILPLRTTKTRSARRFVIAFLRVLRDSVVRHL